MVISRELFDAERLYLVRRHLLAIYAYCLCDLLFRCRVGQSHHHWFGHDVALLDLLVISQELFDLECLYLVCRYLLAIYTSWQKNPGQSDLFLGCKVGQGHKTSTASVSPFTTSYSCNPRWAHGPWTISLFLSRKKKTCVHLSMASTANRNDIENKPLDSGTILRV
jgi:hypothetical protein